MSKKGQSYKALFTATIYSFVGSVFGFIALGLLAEPVAAIAIKFTKMDYFLLALFGLVTVGSVSTKNYAKGLVSVMLGLIISMVGLDPLMGTKRLYDFVNNNPDVEMYPVSYVNDPVVVMKEDNIVSINSCVQIDLMGQAASETVGYTQISGVGGQVDFRPRCCHGQRMAVPFSPSRPQPRREPFPRSFRCLTKAQPLQPPE